MVIKTEERITSIVTNSRGVIGLNNYGSLYQLLGYTDPDSFEYIEQWTLLTDGRELQCKE